MEYEKLDLAYYPTVNEMRKVYRKLEDQHHKLMDYLTTYPISETIGVCPICQSYMPIGKTCKKCGHVFNSCIPYAILDAETGKFKHFKYHIVDIIALNYTDAIQRIKWDQIEEVYTALSKNPSDTPLSKEKLQSILKGLFDMWTTETAKASSSGWTIAKVNDMYSVTFVVDSSGYYFY